MSEDADLQARKALRKKLYEIRKSLTLESDAECALKDSLSGWLAGWTGCTGFYMPIKGEPDVVGVVEAWLALGGERTAALPVVDDNKTTMHYALWNPQCEMTEGVYGIPVPKSDETVVPDIILAPAVGFDECGYRLGNGGGYFDRYLAANDVPATVVVAYDELRCSFGVQSHDIAMKFIATQSGVSQVQSKS